MGPTRWQISTNEIICTSLSSLRKLFKRGGSAAEPLEDYKCRGDAGSVDSSAAMTDKQRKREQMRSCVGFRKILS